MMRDEVPSAIASGAEFDPERVPQCPSCGRKMLSAKALAQMPGEIIRGLRNRRAFVPDAVYEMLRELECQLTCRARCKPQQPAGGER